MNITKQWNPEDSEWIRQRLIEYNSAQLPEEVKTPVQQVSFILRNDEEDIVGGVTGTIFWQTLHINFLWIDASARGLGYGKQLMRDIEQLAVDQACRLIQLDTFSFQAPEFYIGLGYEVVGVIHGHPTPEHQQYYLKKSLAV